jgi:choline dehydrogenase
VNRVCFDGKRAVGVEVEHGGERQTVFGREIVLAAGALHSPPILLRSGVGPRSHLDELGIPVVHDLPGVGENLKDHPSVTLIATPRAGVAGAADPLQQIGLRYTAAGSDQANDMQMYIWSYHAERSPQLRFAMAGIESLFALCPTLQRPKSVGRLRLASADPQVQPLIELNLLAEEEDMRRMVDGVRRAWELLSSAPIAELTDQILRPDAATIADEEQIRDYLRKNVSHLVHPVGTCRMGAADDPLAVVDQQGSVHGLEGLPRANTNLTTIMIGERVADRMRGERPL